VITNYREDTIAANVTISDSFVTKEDGFPYMTVKSMPLDGEASPEEFNQLDDTLQSLDDEAFGFAKLHDKFGSNVVRNWGSVEI